MLKRMTIQEDESRALLAHPTQSRLFSRKETPYKKKAPEEVKYIPFGRFATIHSIAFSLDVNDLSATIDKPQMFDASHFPSMLSQLALNHRIGQFLHSAGIEDNIGRLMKGSAQAAINGTRIVRLWSFHLPNQPVDYRIGGSSPALLATANELHRQPCLRQCLRRLVFLLPDIDIWRDDDFPQLVLHARNRPVTYTLNLKCMTSPSWTTYSLPSWRSLPASRQPFSPFSSE